MVNERGEIIGAWNQIKAVSQGEGFWRDQLAQAKLELARHLDAPQKKQKMDATFRNIEARAEDRMKDLYRKYPSMKPTLAEQQANALRAQADDIESKELDAKLELWRIKRISTLQSIIKYIESR